ncbi:MAG: hypothetical protein ACSHYF_02300 [Verrucomicrobiaceae bacterium]
MIKYCLFILATGLSMAAPTVHLDLFGKSLGGWDAKEGKYADFVRSGSQYRTWKPEITPTLDGGVYVSVRIDHLRGRFASDDHASLEVTFDADGVVESARSSIALQGKRVTSDLVAGTGKLGASAVGLERAAKIGTEMVADLSAKILRENIREPGRVTFPAVLNHNYNLLCLAVTGPPAKAILVDETTGDAVTEEGKKEEVAKEEPKVEVPASKEEEKKSVPLVIDSPKKE